MSRINACLRKEEGAVVRSGEEGSPIMCKTLLSKDKGRSLEFNNLIPLGIRDPN